MQQPVANRSCPHGAIPAWPPRGSTARKQAPPLRIFRWERPATLARARAARGCVAPQSSAACPSPQQLSRQGSEKRIKTQRAIFNGLPLLGREGLLSRIDRRLVRGRERPIHRPALLRRDEVSD